MSESLGPVFSHLGVCFHCLSRQLTVGGFYKARPHSLLILKAAWPFAAMAGLPGSTLEKARPDAELTRLKEPPLRAPGGTAGALVQRQKQPLAEHAGKVGTARSVPQPQPVLPGEGWEVQLPRPSGTLGAGESA